MTQYKQLITGGLQMFSVHYGSILHLKINILILKSASNLNGNLNCSKELEHYAS